MELNGIPIYKSIVLGSFSRTPLAILVEGKLYTALTMKLPSLSPVHLIVPSDLYVQLPLVSPMPKLRPTATASIGCLGDGRLHVDRITKSVKLLIPADGKSQSS